MNANVHGEVIDLTQAAINDAIASRGHNLDSREGLYAAIIDAERARSALNAVIKRLKAERMRWRRRTQEAARVAAQVSRFQTKLDAARAARTASEAKPE